MQPRIAVTLVVPLLAVAPWALAPAAPAGASGPDPAGMSGREIYRAACASCHGFDGAGQPATRLGFDTPLPDFTDCAFASREPDADWVAVAHQGGPVRGFARMMPSFGDAIPAEHLQRAMDHVRTFCGDEDWPRGELNLPRPLVTEKAYPEDEAVWTTTAAAEGDTEVTNEIVYEKRFGARNQVELVVPFGWRETSSFRGPGDERGDDRAGGLGDVAVGLKRALWHDHRRGSIFSATAEVVLPTGDEQEGFGSGHTVFEPFLTFGQVLPASFFLHFQGGLELPLDGDAADEAFWRTALGRSFVSGRWGRTWSPMVELLASRELTGGEEIQWDAVPQMQVTLNTRQHVMLNAGVRMPLDDSSRDPQVIVYLLWDWFDGGFFAGW